jgi:hypothetical protein
MGVFCYVGGAVRSSASANKVNASVHIPYTLAFLNSHHSSHAIMPVSADLERQLLHKYVSFGPPQSLDRVLISL